MTEGLQDFVGYLDNKRIVSINSKIGTMFRYSKHSYMALLA